MDKLFESHDRSEARHRRSTQQVDKQLASAKQKVASLQRRLKRAKDSAPPPSLSGAQENDSRSFLSPNMKVVPPGRAPKAPIEDEDDEDEDEDEEDMLDALSAWAGEDKEVGPGINGSRAGGAVAGSPGIQGHVGLSQSRSRAPMAAAAADEHMNRGARGPKAAATRRDQTQRKRKLSNR